MVRTRHRRHKKHRLSKSKTKTKRRLIKKQSGGFLRNNPLSDTLINAYRHIPHLIQSSYNGLSGLNPPANFLPWTGHYK